MTGAVASEPETRFSKQLRDATTTDHRDAAGAGFVSALMASKLPIEAYADLASQQWFIYTELEDAAERHRDDPVARTFVRDELVRRPVIEEDLRAVLGDDWASKVQPLPATSSYLERLRTAASDSSVAFVAHHYTRYMGDLSGGQFIGRAIDRNFGFSGGPGARFYVFDRIDDVDEFKDEYRRALDSAPWSEADREAIIDEVRVAYRHNQAVISELGEKYTI